MRLTKTTLLIFALWVPCLGLAKSNAIDHHYASGDRVYKVYEGNADALFQKKLEAADRARRAGEQSDPAVQPPAVTRIATNVDDQRPVPKEHQPSTPPADTGTTSGSTPAEPPANDAVGAVDADIPPVHTPSSPIPPPPPPVATVPEIDGNAAMLALALLLALVVGYREMPT